jgi:hypothetical protein
MWRDYERSGGNAMAEDKNVYKLLAELEEQPEEIRKIFVYTICQTMVESGLLEFKGVSRQEGLGTVLIYRNPDSDQMFEITKPEFAQDEEERIRLHIRELLEKQS